MEQDLQSPSWGRRERGALVDEALRQRRMVAWLVNQIAEVFVKCPPDRSRGEDCKETAGCEACWVRWAERRVRQERQEKKAITDRFTPKG